MDQYLLAHLEDLFTECERKNVPTYSAFLSFNEQSAVARELPYLFSSNACLYGNENGERKILFCYPSYYTEEEALRLTNPITLLRLYPKNEKFASPITHRDVLGALTSLGIKRETIGDIIIHEKEAYVYVLTSIVTEIEHSLESIKANRIYVEKKEDLVCPYSLTYEEKLYQVASNRLDAIVGEVFHLSREQAKKEILAHNVITSEHLNNKSDTVLLTNESVSLKGKGKFYYLGEKGTNRKGKLIIAVKQPK